MSKFYVPANNPEDWKTLLAQPDKQWKTDYSAKALAYSWQEADDFPQEVKKVLQSSGISVFKDIRILMAFPEYKVSLPGGEAASQNDIFILAKGNGQLISITVEGKADESFGEMISKWKLTDMGGKKDRLNFLCDQLELNTDAVNDIQYQLLHRTVSAVITAREFNASNALMLVHVFEKTKEKYAESFKAYRQFLALFDVDGKENSMIFAKNINGVNLHFGWVKGELKYLEK